MFQKKKGSIRRGEFIQVKQKETKFSKKKREILQALEFLAKVNFKIKLRDLKILMGILSVAGLFIGLLFDNIYISLILMVVLPVSLLEYIIIKKEDVAMQLDMQIIKYSELIKNTYLSTNSIKDSIKQNMYRFREPVKTIFKDFIEEVEVFNYYPADALQNMNKKLDSPALKKLTEQLILCDKDRRFESSLSAMTMQLNDRRQFLQKWKLLSKDIMQRFFFMLILVNLLIVFTFLSYQDMGKVFLESSLSKPIFAIYALLQMFAAYRTLRKINKVKVE